MRPVGLKLSRASPATATEERLKRLQTHLDQENNILLQIVKSFRQLDRVAYRLGLLTKTQSFTTLVPWWPLISVVGTFSSGKSTFINHYLGVELQPTGNQAVDDKYTVICFSNEETSRTLPGLALDSDPRFPFYQISKEIEESSDGEGPWVDGYLQLKTCRSKTLRGKIIIDSPGFDADEQRTSVLEINDHILNLSDLVLVMFDARHPEPGAMQDTLKHLVAKAITRPDSSKFLYILNQIDVAAREDNPEEVFAAWQRALSQHGLTAGSFYRIYNPQVAPVIEDEQVRARFERKCAQDRDAITTRLDQIEVERAYRIIGVLEKLTRSVEGDLIPSIRLAKERWKRRIAWIEGVSFGLIVLAFVAWTVSAGYWVGLQFTAPWLDNIVASTPLLSLLTGITGGSALYLHFFLRRVVANSVARTIRRDESLGDAREWVAQAFEKNTSAWRSFLLTNPTGWGALSRRRIGRILNDTDRYVQTLNNRFANPSGTEPETQNNGVDKPRTPVETPPAGALKATLDA